MEQSAKVIVEGEWTETQDVQAAAWEILQEEKQDGSGCENTDGMV